MPIHIFARTAAADVFLARGSVVAATQHLEEAIQWLVRAHDRTPDGGVSYGYALRGGWKPSYVETTGYIATTFFNLAQDLQRPDLRDRAIQMADWLCSVQLDDGSFTNTRFSKQTGIVFDTGQDIFGLVRAYRETGDQKYAVAANQAADWLVTKSADETGRWTRNTHMGVPHVYNTRVAWALLQVDAEWPHADRKRVARANLDWAVSEENNGWFDNCAFVPNKAPFTHTIAYAIRGLWESSELLDDSIYREVAIRAASAVAHHVREDGFLSGQFDANGRPAANYCCLTGNCQMAIIWAKLFKQYGDESLRNAAVRAVQYVMSTQNIRSTNLAIRGAIKGSQPLWGRYAPFSYPNWATKFFVDAVSICEEWLE